MEKQIATRTLEKETYTFYLTEATTVDASYIVVYTPKNCFGYSDTVLFTGSDIAYTMWRWVAPWKLRQLEKTYKRLKAQYL